MTGENLATIDTTKFVRLPVDPSTGKPQLNMKISLMRDLKEEDKTLSIPCELARVEQTEKTKAREENRVRLRKLRAGVNMLTAKLADAADHDEGGAEGYRKELENIERWYKVLKADSDEAEFNAKKAEAASDEEVEKLRETVQNGLRICHRAIQREDGERIGGQ